MAPSQLPRWPSLICFGRELCRELCGLSCPLILKSLAVPTGHPGQHAAIVVGDLSRDLSSERLFASVEDIRRCMCVCVCKAVSDWL